MLKDPIYRVRALLFRSRVEREMDEELRFHLELEAEKRAGAGAPPAEAMRGARVAFGGTSRVREECRDARGVGWIEIAWRDIGHAVRTLRSSPAFTATVVLSLALGIGANTAVFTLLRASLWRPLPVNNPGEIFQVQRMSPAAPQSGEPSYSYALFRELGRAAQPYGEVFAKASFGLQKFGTDDSSRERAVGEAVSGNFFSALEVAPRVGRLFEAADDNALGGQRVAVLSYRFWARRFQSDPAAIGRTIFYKETPYTVAGVAQAGFDGVESEAQVDVWVPIASDVPWKSLVSPQMNWLKLMARLRPDNDPRRVEAALQAAFRAHVTGTLLPRTQQPRYKAMFEAQYLRLRPASAGLSTTGRKYEEPLLILMAVVALVLLISCANVANLAMARNRARRNEIAVRLALGASRVRIVSQLSIESALLAFLGTACGLALAVWSCRLLIPLLPQAQPPLAYDIRPDSMVLAFAAGAGVVTAILFGLAPALRASRADANLTAGSGARVTGRSAGGRVLVAGQLALSLLLLTGAGLFLATVRNIAGTDLGFRPEGVVTFDVSFPKGTPDGQARKADEAIRERLQASPGVAAASYAYPDVYGNGGWSLGAEVEGRASAPGEDNEVGMIGAGPGFFETLRLSLLRGRYLTVRDMAGDAPVAIVNESFARYYFGGASALGRRIRLGSHDQPFREIVGVVRDARHYGARERAWRMAYVPASQEGGFLVRAQGNAEALGGIIRSAISGSAASAQVEGVRPLEEAVDAMAGRERMIAALSTVFGALAALLACIGLYGAMAYGVAGRTSELGIRIAVGAQQGDVVWLILKETMQLVAAGGCAGLAAALVLTRFVSSMLYGVTANDPVVFGGAAMVLAAVALLAGFLPARRASRIDPTMALRHE